MKTTTLLRLFLVIGLCIPLSAHAFLSLLLRELAALSDLNARNRAALFKGVAKIVSGPKKPEDRSDAEKVQEDINRPYTFKDLGGDISPDIMEVVDFIKTPERFARVGAKMPKGILLYGPPGTGKTSIARAIAGEADAEFFPASGSDFIEIYVGVGPARVRELFEKARKCEKKAIIFIDEIDAIGGKRHEGTNTEYRNTLNELLKQMDGFARSNITVIAATNRVEDLDEALLRPGRFDRVVKVDLPSVASRAQIFELYCSKINFEGGTEEGFFEKLAQRSIGFSGADIKNVVNEAAVLAAREEGPKVTSQHVTKALDDTLKKKRALRKT